MAQRRFFHLQRDSETLFGYAQAVQVGDVVHVSGTTALNEKMEVRCPDDMKGQMELVYGGLKETLARFGLDFHHVVREQIFVTDMEALIAHNGVRKACFTGGHLPATTAVEIKSLVFPGLMVEVELEARADLDPVLASIEVGDGAQ